MAAAGDATLLKRSLPQGRLDGCRNSDDSRQTGQLAKLRDTDAGASSRKGGDLPAYAPVRRYESDAPNMPEGSELSATF